MSMEELLREGLLKMGLQVEEQTQTALCWFGAELLRWNRRVNLTAITAPRDVVEKHLLDSLAAGVALEVGSGDLLDVGCGAGLPGIPLALTHPRLEVALVDSVNKKIAFAKHACAALGLGPRVRPKHLRLSGLAERDGLARASMVISRAFQDWETWIDFANGYRQEDGRIVVMLGRAPAKEALGEVAARRGLRLLTLHCYALPWSGDPRAVATLGAA